MHMVTCDHVTKGVSICSVLSENGFSQFMFTQIQSMGIKAEIREMLGPFIVLESLSRPYYKSKIRKHCMFTIIVPHIMHKILVLK